MINYLQTIDESMNGWYDHSYAMTATGRKIELNYIRCVLYRNGIAIACIHNTKEVSEKWFK